MPGTSETDAFGPRDTKGKRVSFSPRVIAIILIILLIFLGWIFFWLLFAERNALLKARQDMMANQLDLALAICANQQAKVEMGSQPTHRAQAEAKQLISSLQYGPQHAGFFFILDTQGVMVAHPLRPELEGISLRTSMDAHGDSLIGDLLQLGPDRVPRFSEYYWNWVGETKDANKRIACFATFEAWNWVVVTDTSSADINELVASELGRQLLLLILISIILAFVISITLKRLVLSGIDRMFELARQLKAGDYSARIKVSPTDEMRDLFTVVNKMADNIEHRDEQIRLSQRASVFALAKLAEARDNETGGHLLRVREYSEVLALALRRKPGWDKLITPEFVADLYDAVMLHDIGKVGIEDRVLLKPEALDEAERAEMMSHTLIGAETIRHARERLGATSNFLTIAEQVARSHHERWDGQGYVEGLAGENIPPAARIFTFADVYDALTTSRPYKAAFSHQDAVAMMTEESGSRFDPVVFQAFLECEAEFGKIRDELKDTTAEQPGVASKKTPGYYPWDEHTQRTVG